MTSTFQWSNQYVTPTITFATPGDLSVAYTTQQMNITRVGNSITVQGTVSFTPTYTTSSGNLQIMGLPLTSNAYTSAIGNVLFSSSITFPAGATQAVSSLAASSSIILLRGFGSASSQALFTVTQFTSGLPYTVQFSIMYQVT